MLLTKSEEYFPFADRVLLIDSDGLVKVRADVRSPEFLSTLRNTTAQRDGHADQADAGPASSGEETQEKDEAPDAPVEDEGDPARQRGDFWLYVFFLKTIGAVRTLIWLFLTISTVVIEKFPGMCIGPSFVRVSVNLWLKMSSFESGWIEPLTTSYTSLAMLFSACLAASLEQECSCK